MVAWLESNFCVSCGSHIAKLLTSCRLTNLKKMLRN